MERTHFSLHTFLHHRTPGPRLKLIAVRIATMESTANSRRSIGHKVATRVSSSVSRRPLIPRRMDRITHTTASADPAYTTHTPPHVERTAHDVTINGRENGVAGRE